MLSIMLSVDWIRTFFLVFIGSCFSLWGNSSINSLQSGELKIQDSQRILHLKGSPEELGYQHGQLLKEAIACNVKRFIDDYLLVNSEHPQIKFFIANLPQILEYIPEDYKRELQGLAKGAELPYDKILLFNLFPEMFHCSGLTVSGQATQQGELYHVRVLDYSVGKDLQETAVLMVVEPNGKIPFVNVSYAGFIGCVTGMNQQHIALGEIGGKGYGQLQGMPMAFLLRHILEKAANLPDVKKILTSTPRTCEYYYLFSDGKTRQSLGVYATGSHLHFIEPGVTYALFEENPSHQVLNDKRVLSSDQIDSSPYQTVFYKDEQKQQQWGLIHRQPTDCLILTGFTHPERYPVLIHRLLERYGQIGIQDLQEIIKTPAARPSNLHNAIFAPMTLDVWISHAGPQGEPACDQPYHHFNLTQWVHS